MCQVVVQAKSSGDMQTNVLYADMMPETLHIRDEPRLSIGSRNTRTETSGGIKEQFSRQYGIELTAGAGMSFSTETCGIASFDYDARSQTLVSEHSFQETVPSGTQEVRYTHHMEFQNGFLDGAMIHAYDGCTWHGEKSSPAHFIPLDSVFTRKRTHAMLHPGGGKEIQEGVAMAYDYFILTNPKFPKTYYLVATLPNFDSQERMELKKTERGLDITFVSDHEGTQIGTVSKDILIVQGESYGALSTVYREKMHPRFSTPKSTLEEGLSWYTWGGSGRYPKELATQIQQLWHLNERLVREGLQRVTKAFLDDNYFGIHEWGDFYIHPDEQRYLARFVEMCTQIDVNPCVWLAPLLAAEDSQLVSEHPEWFLQDEHGKFVVFPIKQPVIRHEDQPAFSPSNLKEQLFNRNVYVLDFSKREVKDHIVSLFVRMQQSGVKGVKFDYGLAAALGGEYADKTATSKQHFRELLQEITDACPGLELEFSSCRPSDVWGYAHSLRANPDSTVPFEGLVTNNVIGHLIRWLANDSPLSKNAQLAMRAINSEHYYRSAFSSIVYGDMFKGLITVISDQLHEDFDGLKIDGEVAALTHEQVIRFARSMQVTLGDQLQRVRGPMQDKLIELLKRIQAVEEIEPVDMMKLMQEFSTDPLSTLTPVQQWMIGLFMPPSMAESR